MGVRVHLISNAASGSGTDVEALTAALRERGATVADEAPERVVVAGGDGTVAQGAETAGRLRLPLAVIPTGTANDFARVHGLPCELEEALDLAARGERTRPLELGTIEGRAFVNTASTGLAPSAAHRAAPFKRFLGPLAYPVGAALAGARDRPVRCRVGSAFDGEAWQVMVACSGAFGGGAEIDAADPQDGRLDVVVLPAGPRLGLVKHALAMRRGDIAGVAGSVHECVDELTVTVPDGTRFNVDGEVETYGGEVRFTARADAFELVVG